MSSGIYLVVDAINAIGAAALVAASDIKTAVAAQQASNAAGITTGVGGSGMGSTPGGSPSGGGMTGGMRGGGGVTVHALGPGLAGDVISALKQLGGRT